MKELNAFKKFLAEGQINEGVPPAALAKVYQDEIKSLMASGEDDVVPALEAGIEMLKTGVLPEKVNMQTAKEVARIQGEFDFDEFARIYMDKAQGMMEEQPNDKSDVLDYADRIMGAGEPGDIDLVGLVDFYAENPDDIPEPMDAEIFMANVDAIRDRVANYVAMMGEGKDELDEGLFDKVIQKLKDKRAAKKEKERFTKGLDMKDFAKGAPEIDPEFTAGLEEGTVNEGMYQEVDNMLSKTAVHMKADVFVDELIEELEAMKGAIPFLHKALKTIMVNNNIPE